MGDNEAMVKEEIKHREGDSSAHLEHTKRLLQAQALMLGRIADRLDRVIEIQESVLFERDDGKTYMRTVTNQY